MATDGDESQLYTGKFGRWWVDACSPIQGLVSPCTTTLASAPCTADGRYTAVEQHFPNPLHSLASVYWRPCIPPRRRPRPPHATLWIARIAQSSLPIRGRRTRKAHAKPHRNGIRVRLLRRESLPGRPMRYPTMAALIVEAPPVFFGSPQFESDSDGEVEVGGDECASAA